MGNPSARAPRRAPIRHRRRIRTAAALAAISVGGLVAVVAPDTPTASAAVQVGPDCGPRVPRGLIGSWKCTFADDFEGTTLDPLKWSALTTARSGVNLGECRLDDPDNIRVANGTLRLTARREAAPFVCESPRGDYVTEYTGGAVTTYNKFSQAYGRFEMRARFPSAKVAGLHSAFWLWPQEILYGNNSGELDIVEFRTVAPDRVVPTANYTASDPTAVRTNWKCFIHRPEDFHTYAMAWTTKRLTFIYDGEACFSHEWEPAEPLLAPAPFDQPFALMLNQSIGANHNLPTDRTPFPSTMQVDYVRVWK